MHYFGRLMLHHERRKFQRDYHPKNFALHNLALEKINQRKISVVVVRINRTSTSNAAGKWQHIGAGTSHAA